MRSRRQASEQEQKRQGIIEVSEGVDEGGVALLDDVVQRHARRMVLLQARRIADFSATQRPGDLLRKRLLLTELPQQRLMEEILDVFGVIERSTRGRGLGRLLLIPRLTRVNTYSAAPASSTSTATISQGVDH